MDGLESQFESDLFDAKICGYQHLPGTTNLQIQLVLHRGNTCILFKHLTEIGVTNIIILCIMLKINLFPYVLPDLETYLPDYFFHPFPGEISLFFEGDHETQQLHDHAGCNLLKTWPFLLDYFEYLMIGVDELLPVSNMMNGFFRPGSTLAENLPGYAAVKAGIILCPPALFIGTVTVPYSWPGHHQ